jgi:flagellar assembly factor FliW
MELKTKFYGVVNCLQEDIIDFPSGLPGFEECKAFVLFQPKESIFACLQSVDDPGLAFVVISPYALCTDYSINLPAEDTKALQLQSPSDALVLAIVCIREKMEDSSANLQAPVVIHKTCGLGRQVILPESGYPVRFPLWKKDAIANCRCS